MRFLKGDIKTAIENAKKKQNRIIIISISKHFPDISENKIPGNIIEQNGIHYMITQYVEGEPRHYDTEEIKIYITRRYKRNSNSTSIWVL